MSTFSYCSQRCPYCDFTLTTAPIPHQEYLSAVIRAGGETPRALSPRSGQLVHSRACIWRGHTRAMVTTSLHAFIERSDHLLGFRHDVEITLEANPAELTLAELYQWKVPGSTDSA